MTIPSDFCALMREQYGDTMAESLFQGLSEEPCVSVRLNPRKSPVTQVPGGHPVPHCPGAFYLDERPAFTFDPLFHAGVYYVQEASSMYLAKALEEHLRFPLASFGAYASPHSDSRLSDTPSSSPRYALDLCAAPGGKSTLLRSLLPDDWWLVSNEPMPKRAQVLAENMAKWGYPQSIVTQNYPADFAFLSHQFDLLVTDVPCSGEGMFRKDEGAIRDWSLENVTLCWQRQRSILSDVWPALKPGGLLIYSTCTFNHFEDEDNVQWIAGHLGADILEQRHFFPGRDKGEGFFLAVLRKYGTSSVPGSDASPLSPEAFVSKVRRNLHTLLCGIPEPEQTPKGPVPPHILALSTSCPRGNWPEYELTYTEALAYLRREALRIEAPKGIVLVTFRGIPLGFVKSVGQRANNLYPQEWRIRTTYTTPFCLLSIDKE